VEMSGQLRAASNQLQRDLEGLTVPVRPWPESSSGQGYFEIVEGPFWDLGLGPIGGGGIYQDDANASRTSMGDIDDVLMFTTHTTGTPFVGQVLASILDASDPNNVRLYIDPGNPTNRLTLESRVAEVAWFTRWNDWNDDGHPDPEEITLHRRVFLVLPNLDLSHPTIQALSPLQFYSAFDLSVRTVQPDLSVSQWVRTPNSLKDLTQRENRIAHDVSGGHPDPVTPSAPFPYPLRRPLLVPQGSVLENDNRTYPIDVARPAMPGAVLYGESYGSDVILSNLLAFDVKVYDPAVVVGAAGGGSDRVLPGDPGYSAAATPIGQGGYVDLFYNRYLLPADRGSSFFAGAPLPAINRVGAPEWGLDTPYDTWTLFYERDGVDQDGDGIVDQGTDGIDNDNQYGVDDAGERETSPPYPVALRGIQVRIRAIDRDSRQVRQVTVVSDFIPE
jgi:hypothetical protein